MRKHLFVAIIAISCTLLISWGYVGHKTVAYVAEQHLTPQAKEAIMQLLDGHSIADIASWADEVRNQPEYKATTSWHFLNVPLGLNAKEFIATVESSPNENLLTALHKNEADLASPHTTLEQKAIALKFIVHFVGDAHQPMHISRAEDKGGNTIQVRFDGRGTNLHSLWDSRLIDKQGLSDGDFVKRFDQLKPVEIGKLQSTSPIEWMFESYQISSRLYKEVEGSNKLGDDYYHNHINIVNQRLEQGGIRLAGLLNSFFKRGLPSSITAAAKATPPLVVSEGQHINVAEVSKHIGEYVTVKGKVFGYKELVSMTLVNVGAAYPDQLLTVVLRGDAKSMTKTVDNMTIEVTGKVIDYKGKPEIEVRDKSSILILLNAGINGK